VTVSSLGNARSLKGGTLLLTPLRASDGKVYGQAQGGVVIPGSVAAGIYSTVRTNHQNAGRIPNGAIIEASSPSIEFGESIDINLNVADFTVTQKVVESINNELGESAALPLNHRTIRLSIPSDPYERTEFLSKVMDLPAPKVEPSARVVINARTGSVVMNKSVRLEPCAVTHGNITVRIGEINTVSQSPAFSYSRPRIQRNTAASANERPMPLISLEEGPNLGAVVKALNTLGATPQDLLAILQALKAVGSLKADLEVI
jgi:flagellar P-ring protein precursor FlgI